MEQSSRLLAVTEIVSLVFSKVELQQHLRSSSSLAALLLESSDSLLSPLGSHLCSSLTLRKDVV